MSIGIGQIIVIVLLIVVLFGKYPSISKDITTGLHNIRAFLRTASTSVEEKPKQLDHVSDKDKVEKKEKDNK